MNRKLLSNAVTGVLLICALIITGLAVRREILPPKEPIGPRPAVAARPISGVEHIADTGLVIGPTNARLRIVEFSDFQCPFCAEFAGVIRQVRHDHPGQIALVWRNLPLTSIHPFALAAANAAECANAQGRFEAFHDVVFDHQDKLGVWDWDRFAQEAAVPNRSQFATCIAGSHYSGRVEADLRSAAVHKFRSTPTIIVNGTLYDGVPSDAQIQGWLAHR